MRARNLIINLSTEKYYLLRKVIIQYIFFPLLITFIFNKEYFLITILKYILITNLRKLIITYSKQKFIFLKNTL